LESSGNDARAWKDGRRDWGMIGITEKREKTIGKSGNDTIEI
jgi:hypothetical protein